MIGVELCYQYLVSRLKLGPSFQLSPIELAVRVFERVQESKTVSVQLIIFPCTDYDLALVSYQDALPIFLVGPDLALIGPISIMKGLYWIHRMELRTIIKILIDEFNNNQKMFFKTIYRN